MATANKKDVVVERRFQRSIRLDTDLADQNALHGFICTPSFSSVLTTVTEHIEQSKQGGIYLDRTIRGWQIEFSDCFFGATE